MCIRDSEETERDLPGGVAPKQRNSCFNDGIAQTNWVVALAAAAAEGEEAEEGDVFIPGNVMVAVAAVRAGLRDAFADGPAADACLLYTSRCV